MRVWWGISCNTEYIVPNRSLSQNGYEMMMTVMMTMMRMMMMMRMRMMMMSRIRNEQN